MSEEYYRYNSDNVNIDLTSDEVYDYVLDREKMKELDYSRPRNIKDFSSAGSNEHFGNLGCPFSNNILLIILIVIVLYFVYNYVCEKKPINF